MTKLNLPCTKYKIAYSSTMKKDLKRTEKRGLTATSALKWKLGVIS